MQKKVEFLLPKSVLFSEYDPNIVGEDLFDLLKILSSDI